MINNAAIEVYGTSDEIRAMALRFKTALRGGDKLANNEVIALAQIAKITNLNPFIGELWYIPGKGPMIGIAGARRLWNEKSADGGGWSSVDIQPCPPDEAGYTGDIKDLAGAFKAVAHDSGATAQYQKIFTDTIKVMRESGSTDPFGDAKEICGPRPMWVGYGYATVSETSRMNKTQLARKRAEADALKKCINVPFGLDISVEHDSAPTINAEVTELKIDRPINADAATGEIIEPEPVDEVPAIELINPMLEKWVKYAAEKWNISTEKAAKNIASLKLGNKVDLKDFKAIVNGDPK